jgi:dihydrofolate reductase
MGDIVLTEFISLDGVIEDPGGSEGSVLGAWTFQFNRGDEGNEFKLDELRAAGAQLFGRVTYQGFAAAWPARRETTGEFGVKINALPKHVVSTTLSDADASWENSTVIRDNVAGAMTRLKQQVQGDILLAGSASLARSLFTEGLIDRINLMLFPVLLGTGKRLFAEGLPRSSFELMESKPIGPDGVVVLTYRTKR